MKYLLGLSSILIIALSGCSSLQRSGFYYKDKNNIGDESTWIISQDTFSSKEECVKRAFGIANSTNNTNNFDYECGYKCQNKEGFNICNKTEK